MLAVVCHYLNETFTVLQMFQKFIIVRQEEQVRKKTKQKKGNFSVQFALFLNFV